MTIEEGAEFFEDIARLEYDLVDSYHTDEGVYGRKESYHREKAEHHEQVAMWLKELQAHREAWKKVEDRIKITKLGYANSDSIACMAKIMAFNRSLEIIAECRPKEGDADETTK